MTAIALARESTRRNDGGVAARRAVVRWAWRMFRREWRQQVLILMMLTLAVAAAIGFGSAAYNMAPISGKAEFGSAHQFFEFDDPEPENLTEKLTAATQWFGTIDAIGHRPVVVPGLLETVDHRAQDPAGAYSGPLLDLLSGHYPRDRTEVAVTDWVADNLQADIGATFALDGVSRTVVGIVENPSKLSDEFALLHPSELAGSERVIMLVDSTRDRVDDFRPPGDRHRIVGSIDDLPDDVFAALLVLIVSTIALFLVALIAAASFIVIAQRRLPQLGMFAAVGATEKHLRLTMLAGGAAAGAVAAVLGALLGVGSWVALAPWAETSLGYRIDAFNIPWWLVTAGMILAVITATAAAWWPARTMSRVPTVAALSGRRPSPSPVHRSALAALALIGGGVVALAIGGNTASEGTINFEGSILIIIGALAAVGGVLLLSPLAIRAVGTLAKRLPITPRLALRDLSRYQARSGAALAAISLVIGIPVAIVATTAAADNASGAGNLSSRQMWIRSLDMDGPFVPAATVVATLQPKIDEIVEALGNATAIAVDAARDPASEPEPGLNGFPAPTLARRIDDGWADLSLLFIPTPELLAASGLDLDDLDDAAVYTSETGPLVLLGSGPTSGRGGDVEPLTSVRTIAESYSSLPGTFVSPAYLAERGWEVVPAGRWLIETEESLTQQQLADARNIAAPSGLLIETRDRQPELSTLRFGAISVGMLIALTVLAMTVGLVRTEVAGDVRTLTATGATRWTRRKLAAVTTGVLATLGVILGVAGAYIALVAGQLSDLAPVPVSDLLIIGVGTPLLATSAGWLLAGREPTAIVRRPIE